MIEIFILVIAAGICLNLMSSEKDKHYDRPLNRDFDEMKKGE